jgi:chromate transporter
MQQSKPKTLWALFTTFFKAGTFTFAGGLAMLPVIEKDVVEKHKLMGKDDFLEYATLSQTLPGSISVNCACFVGKSVAGFLGMLVATVGATFSAVVLMIAATVAMRYIPQIGPAAGAMHCVRAASAALILSAAFSLGAHNLKSAFAVVVMLAAFAAVFFLGVGAPLIVVAAALVGYAWRRISTRKGRGGV